MNNTAHIPSLIANSMSTPALVESVRFFLNWSPEIKHEGLVCTHLSAHLRSTGVDSRREVSLAKRRIDLVIEKVGIEAKYHFEGDILEIEAILSSGARFDPAGWNSAPKSILAELVRGKASYFLWHVCVRSPGEPERYKYASMIEKFYKHAAVQTLQQATAAVESFVDQRLLPLFKAKAPLIQAHPLPRIEADHSVLLSRLYFFPARDDA